MDSFIEREINESVQSLLVQGSISDGDMEDNCTRTTGQGLDPESIIREMQRDQRDRVHEQISHEELYKYIM